MFAGQAEVVELVNGSGSMNTLLARMTPGGPISHISCGVRVLMRAWCIILSIT